LNAPLPASPQPNPTPISIFCLHHTFYVRKPGAKHADLGIFDVVCLKMCRRITRGAGEGLVRWGGKGGNGLGWREVEEERGKREEGR